MQELNGNGTGTGCLLTGTFMGSFLTECRYLTQTDLKVQGDLNRYM